jgi:hypothetical protein
MIPTPSGVPRGIGRGLRCVPRYWGLALGLALSVLTAAGVARASNVKVVILRPADQVAVEAVSRIEGELSAAGFETLVLVHKGDTDPRAEVERAARDNGADAALSIVDTAESRTAEVWIADRLTGKTVVQHLEVSGGDARASAALAVRIVELLRASLLELLFRRKEDAAPAPRPAPEVTKWVQAGLPEQAPPVALEAGAAVVHSFSGIGPNLAAVVRASHRFSVPVGARVSLLVPLTRAHVATSAGSGALSQTIALAEIVGALRSGGTVRPTAVAGAGVYRADLQGTGVAPYIGKSDATWGAAANLGLGVELRLGRQVGLAAEAQAAFMFPYPIVHVAGVEVAHAGRPSVVGTLTFMTFM